MTSHLKFTLGNHFKKNHNTFCPKQPVFLISGKLKKYGDLM